MASSYVLTKASRDGKNKKTRSKYAHTFILEYFTFSICLMLLFTAIALIVKMIIPATDPKSRFEEILNQVQDDTKAKDFILTSSYVLTVLRG